MATPQSNRRPVGKAPVASKPLPQSGPDGDEQQQYNQQDNGSAVSKADKFKQVAPAQGLNIPVGQYRAFLVGASLENNDKGESVKFTYEIEEGEQEGKEVPAWYGIFDKEENPQQGIGFLRRDFLTLTGEDFDYDQADDQLEALAAERKLVTITVKLNKGYTNIYLQGLAEEQ